MVFTVKKKQQLCLDKVKIYLMNKLYKNKINKQIKFKCMQMKTLCLLYFTSININISEGRKTLTIDRRTLPQILRQMRLSCTCLCVYWLYPGYVGRVGLYNTDDKRH